MGALSQFSDLIIDWNLTPEHAVTMYLEWGNNDYSAEYPPVRSKNDVSTYFVVDTWSPEGAVVRLVRRNSEQAEDLVTVPLPEHLIPSLKEECGNIKGIFAPTEAIKGWLREQLGHE